MNLKNLLTLTIHVEDYNTVAQNPELLQKLKKLTISPHSGMNFELSNFERASKHRQVNSKILTAYRGRKLVGWALMSREPTDFSFLTTNDDNTYRSSDGYLFEVFIDPAYRKQGIGTELIKVARRKANGIRLVVSPHDSVSRKFYDNFKHFKNKEI